MVAIVEDVVSMIEDVVGMEEVVTTWLVVEGSAVVDTVGTEVTVALVAAEA